MTLLACTSTTTVALPRWKAASVVVAVMVCVPARSVRVRDGPLPSGPSRLEVHWRADDRSVPCASTAAAWNMMACVAETMLPPTGMSILTRGSARPRSVTVSWGLAAAGASRLW